MATLIEDHKPTSLVPPVKVDTEHVYPPTHARIPEASHIEPDRQKRADHSKHDQDFHDKHAHSFHQPTHSQCAQKDAMKHQRVKETGKASKSHQRKDSQ